jgi:hypothetical protein
MAKRILSLFLVLGLASSASAALVAYYPLDSRMFPGGPTADLGVVGPAADGTLMGTADFVVDPQRGNVLQVNNLGHEFDPNYVWPTALASYVDCGNPAKLNLAGDTTVMCWVKFNHNDMTSWHGIVNKGDTSYRIQNASGDRLRVGIRWFNDPPYGPSHSPDKGANYINLWTCDSGNAPNAPQGNDEWHHFCLVYGLDRITAVVDGQYIASAWNDVGIQVNDWKLFIGGCDEKKDWVNGRWFTGYIDEVRIYDTGLSISEIRDISGIPEPATVILLSVGGLALLRKRR